MVKMVKLSRGCRLWLLIGTALGLALSAGPGVYRLTCAARPHSDRNGVAAPAKHNTWVRKHPRYAAAISKHAVD